MRSTKEKKKEENSLPEEHQITFIKVLRRETSVFVEISENDFAEAIKAKIARFFPGDVRLYFDSRLLDETASLYMQSIKNGAELFVTRRSQTNDSGWESLEEVGGK